MYLQWQRNKKQRRHLFDYNIHINYNDHLIKRKNYPAILQKLNWKLNFFFHETRTPRSSFQPKQKIKPILGTILHVSNQDENLPPPNPWNCCLLLTSMNCRWFLSCFSRTSTCCFNSVISSSFVARSWLLCSCSSSSTSNTFIWERKLEWSFSAWHWSSSFSFDKNSTSLSRPE